MTAREFAREALAALWLGPVAAGVWLLAVLPMWGAGLIGEPRAYGTTIVFRVQRPPLFPWWASAWDGWLGLTLPYAVLLRHDAGDATLRHELRHMEQWRALGVLFPIVYGLLLLGFGYAGNPLEIDARNRES